MRRAPDGRSFARPETGELAMRRQVDAQAASMMVVLCLLWGLQQVAIKAASVDVATMLQAALRSGVAAGCVWVYSRFVSKDRWFEDVLRPGLLVGGLFAIEFLCVAESLRWTTASHVSVMLYTAPMFAAVGLHLRIPEERLGRVQWLGIGLAFLGVCVTFLGKEATASVAAPSPLKGDLIALLGGAAWGMTTVAVRASRLSEAPATQTLFYQLAGGFLLLLPLAAITGQLRFEPTRLAWGSLAFQALVVSFVSYLIWFRMLRTYWAAPLGVLSFMTPIFGVILGAVLLRETLTVSFLAGAALVLTGLFIVNGHGLLRRLARG